MMGKFRVMKLKRRSVSNKMRCNRIPHLYQKKWNSKEGKHRASGIHLGSVGHF